MFYKFKSDLEIQENDKYYNSSPTLNDKVHVLVSVIPAGSVSILSDGVVKKMREVRLAASEMGKSRDLNGIKSVFMNQNTSKVEQIMFLSLQEFLNWLF